MNIPLLVISLAILQTWPCSYSWRTRPNKIRHNMNNWDCWIICNDNLINKDKRSFKFASRFCKIVKLSLGCFDILEIFLGGCFTWYDTIENCINKLLKIDWQFVDNWFTIGWPLDENRLTIKIFWIFFQKLGSK